MAAGLAIVASTCHYRGVFVVWLLIGVALVIAEVFTTTIVLAMFGTGAFAAAVVSAVGLNLTIQVMVFAIVSVSTLLFLRPVIQRHLPHSVPLPSGTAGVEGAVGQVLEQVDSEHGLIRIEGEMWRARPYDGSQVFPVDTQVRVVSVQGATALVWRD